MNFVITDEMLDLTVLVGIIFGVVAAGFIAYGEVQRRRVRMGRMKRPDTQRRKKTGRPSKSR
jgi:hypothetical protein